MLDRDGYPTDDTLERVCTFTGTPRELVDLLSEIMQSYGGVTVSRGTDHFDRPVHNVWLVTGGWSGNESVVTYLERSLFWFMFWQSSRRGGAYEFEVPDNWWEQAMIEWPTALAFVRQERDGDTQPT